jgi:hypothetical protein
MAQIDPNEYTIAVVIVTVFICVSVIVWAIRAYGNPKPDSIAYPPYTSPCPDFWVSTGTNADGTHKCKPLQATSTDSQGPNNTLANIGINGLPTCDTNNNNSAAQYNLALTDELSYDTTPNAANPTADFAGMNDSIKCKWANKCGVYWEGISGYACEELDGGSKADEANGSSLAS